MKHVFLFDPKAFYSQQWKMDTILDNIGQFFRTQENQDFSIQFSRYRRNAILIIQEEAEKTKPGDVVRIYAIGGEEILFDCLNGIAHFPNMQLAAVPFGETDNFLKIFGDKNIESFRNISAMIKSASIPTDIIKWGVNYALSSCYIGANLAAPKKISSLKSGISKSVFFVLSKISSFFGIIFPAFNKRSAVKEYSISIDDADYSGRYSMIHVANSPYFNGKKIIVSEASPDNGLLDIVLIKAEHPLKILFELRKYFSERRRSKNCVFVQGKKITIHSKSQMWIQLDSEYIQDTSINLNIIPHAIQFVVPEGLSYPISELAAS
ncbi:MAG: hypothetical protein FWC97_09780 [Treponema sp.]|nr:hypothetical protein [Treponema sp.]